MIPVPWLTAEESRRLAVTIEEWSEQAAAVPPEPGSPVPVSAAEEVEIYRQVTVTPEGDCRLAQPARGVKLHGDLSGRGQLVFISLVSVLATFSETVAPLWSVSFGTVPGGQGAA